jgi:hypothetical protein
MRLPLLTQTSCRGLTCRNPEIAAYIAALLKAFFTAQGQHIGQRRDVANTVDLQECLCLRILCLADLLDLSIVLLDLGGSSPRSAPAPDRVLARAPVA